MNDYPRGREATVPHPDGAAEPHPDGAAEPHPDGAVEPHPDAAGSPSGSSAEFPPGFLWGVSTASYQIEGAVKEGGRGASIWDTFSHEPDRIADGGTGDVACDHFHRYRQDVGLIAGLGANAYRFSIAWPRIQPSGSGPALSAGLAFYDRLVDALLEHGIAPVATLYHWDLPQELQDAGGWSNRDTALRFGEYAGAVAAALGDRVRLWITLNEPVIHMIYGHFWGLHAPGQQLFDDPFPVAHHQLLGHGLAVAALRASTPSAAVTLANNYSPVWAVGPDGRRESATDEDRAAAAAYDVLHNRLFTDPVLLGRYPDGLAAFPGGAGLHRLVRDGDLAAISAPLDAWGVNYYCPAGAGAPAWGGPLPFDLRLLDGYPLTYFGWPVVPGALRHLLTGLRERYGHRLPPVYVTENGTCCEDTPGPDGSIVDDARISYLDSHIGAMAEAMADGVPIAGHFVWSLLDNFEWAEGYTKRFGLVHVDFETQVRTPKSSYHWYRDLIAGAR
jgi:beta-glucosidase